MGQRALEKIEIYHSAADIPKILQEVPSHDDCQRTQYRKVTPIVQSAGEIVWNCSIILYEEHTIIGTFHASSLIIRARRRRYIASEEEDRED